MLFRHIFLTVTWRRLRNLFMLLVLIGLYLVLAGTKAVNLNGVGAPFLFWHEQALIQFVSIVSLGFLIEEWVYVAFLLDTDPEHPNPSDWYFDFGDGKTPRKLKSKAELIRAGMTSSIACTLVLCVVFTTAAVIFRASVDLPTNVKWWLVFIYLYIGLFCGAVMRWTILSFLGDVGEKTINKRVLREDKIKESLAARRLATEGGSSGAESDNAELDSSFLVFHRVAFWKQSATLLAALVLCLLHWMPWTRGLFQFDLFRSVAGYFCTFLTMVLGAYGFAAYYRRRPWFELIVGLGLAVALAPAAISLVTGISPAMAQPVRGLTGTTPRPTANNALKTLQTTGLAQRQALGSTASDTSQTDRPAMEAWKKLLGAKWPEQKPPLVIIANSGGGIKAQMWSTIVLSVIEQRLATNASNANGRLFPHHVRLMTGTSGGTVGASYWVATVPPWSEGGTWINADPRAMHYAYHANAETRARAVPLQPEVMIEAMGKDTLSDAARQMFFNDLLGAPLNVIGRLAGHPHLLDARGRALEFAWERHTSFQAQPEKGLPALSPLSQPFQDLNAGEQMGWRPTLVFAPCVAEDGRRFLISNQPVEYLLTSEPGAEIDSLAGYSARLLDPDHGMAVSTVARLNANFPIVVDSPSIPLKEEFRLMDAGYIDNYGLVTATQWLQANRTWLSKQTSGVLLVQVSATHLERQDALADSGSGLPEAVGFVNASFNKTLHHQDMVLDRLQTWFAQQNPPNQDEAPPFFQFISMEYAGPASLSWYLTSAEKYSLLYPFLNPDDPGGDTDIIRKDKFTPDFQDRVFTQGQAVFDERENQRESLKKLKASRVTIEANLNTLEHWWISRGVSRGN